jgi:hypothetical protein
MSFFAYAGPESHLTRYNTLSAIGATPGQTRWVNNKGTDQTTLTNPENMDGTGHWEVYCYNPGSAQVLGYWYDFVASTADISPSAVAIGTGANAAFRYVVVAMDDTPATSWGWFAFAGVVDLCGTVGTTDIAVGDFLKFDVDTALSYAPIKDGTAETDKSVAIALTANATDTVVTRIRCILLGKGKVVTT